MTFTVVFMGSPDFALPTLRALAAHYRLLGVVTQPDRPAGRGRNLTPPPVKVLAHSLGIETIQPQRLRVPEAQAKLLEWRPDLIVVTAFGQILRQNVLDLPPYGCINVHASLLPRWRGAAPIQAAILHGDAVTGATIMRMDAGIDTGPVLSRRVVPIEERDTAATLSQRLAESGAELLMDTLPGYLGGELRPQAQPEEGATYAGMLQKHEGQLDFTQAASVLERRVRAFNPWPGAFFLSPAGQLKVHRAHTAGNEHLEPGQLGVIDRLPAVATLQGWLVLDEVQPAGKKPLPGEVFLRGIRQWQGNVHRQAEGEKSGDGYNSTHAFSGLGRRSDWRLYWR
ncbi:MAG TPA: methionyl-tRNA formyltransferase [Levilinea sp.]|nr:methionyl-tRNA formyltransferase [Levilinea sp.]